MSRFELIEGTSCKFWEVSLHGTQLIVHWGRIGTRGQSKVYDFPDAAEAEVQQGKLIRQKLAGGYVPVESNPADSGADTRPLKAACSFGCLQGASILIAGQGPAPPRPAKSGVRSAQ
ncbi:MAG: hypothetical protein RLZZ436_3628 [Planctomycetota bacterium]|jgi:predicted DNA-binding WGR domain protein